MNDYRKSRPLPGAGAWNGPAGSTPTTMRGSPAEGPTDGARTAPPKFVMPEEPTRPKVPVGLILAGVGLAILAGGLLLLRPERPDPHYTTARDWVQGYERGKTEEQRNYGNEVYGQALNELALVSPESVSAPAAESLSREIRAGIDRFKERQAAEQKVLEARRDSRQERFDEFVLAQRRAALNPVTEFPECEEGEGHSGGAAHRHPTRVSR